VLVVSFWVHATNASSILEDSAFASHHDADGLINTQPCLPLDICLEDIIMDSTQLDLTSHNYTLAFENTLFVYCLFPFPKIRGLGFPHGMCYTSYV
jgi:hypothetical protein